MMILAEICLWRMGAAGRIQKGVIKSVRRWGITKRAGPLLIMELPNTFNYTPFRTFDWQNFKVSIHFKKFESLGLV